MHFLAGVLRHAYALTAINNPTVNSNKRLVPGFEAPVYVAWSGKNRSPLIRVHNLVDCPRDWNCGQLIQPLIHT